jgi:hypothetical protein
MVIARGTERDSTTVGDCELVVPGREAAPLLEGVEEALDDVSALAGFLVEADRPASFDRVHGWHQRGETAREDRAF